jgi:two-component system, NarL family, nitrate/nitrite response regulator NarL
MGSLGNGNMRQCVATFVIEPRSLVREALVSLMASHSYEVVGGVASTADIDKSLLGANAPRLVILGPQPSDEAASAASSIRRLWPEAKIVLLFERASLADFQKLLASEIDGCIPLFASPDTLIGALQQIITADHRVMVFKSQTGSAMPSPMAWQDKGNELGLAPNNLTRSDDAGNAALGFTTSLRVTKGFTQREEEILKSVVKGHSNKTIARTYGLADSTIKVHMKSILRKIHVANRTQAAIWGLERGYGADGSRNSPALRPPVHEAAAA